MEGIREISKSYYAKATEDEKECVTKFFRKIDINREGKISLEVFKNSGLSSWLSTEDTFKKLDKNGDGALKYDDVLCLYYMEKKMNLSKCNVCSDVLLGPYFSCTVCLEKLSDTYNLCSSCYSYGHLSHEHSLESMLDHYSLINAFKKSTLLAKLKRHRKKEMEELHEIADAHYRAASPHLKGLARQFFESMDTDGDGTVNISEFLTFMGKQGYHEYMNSNPYLFQELDSDGNGNLDFSEVMTLYYIIKSGRPFCNSCRKFIPGVYFSCVECFKNNSETPFCLCCDCYQSTKCGHSHNGIAQFLDNYTLLQTGRDPVLAQSPAVTLDPAPSHSNAIVPARDTYKMRTALKAFEIGLAIGTITSCTILFLNKSDVAYLLLCASASSKPRVSSIASNLFPVLRSKWKVAFNAFEVALTIGSVAGAAARTIM